MIKHVKLGDKEYPVKYGFNALAMFTEEVDRGLDAIGENMTIGEILTFIYVGLKDGARAEGKEFKLTKVELADLLDESPEALERFFHIFTEQMPKLKGVAKGGK